MSMVDSRVAPFDSRHVHEALARDVGVLRFQEIKHLVDKDGGPEDRFENPD
jgi:hypothetical protein